MGFDKNTVIGIALIMLIFFGFEIYNVKQQAEYEKTHPKSKTDASKYPTGDSATSTKASNLVDSLVGKKTDASEFLKNVTDSTQAQNLGSFAAFAQANEQLTIIENEDCIYTFSNKGGVIKKVVLKDYKTSTKKPLILFEDHGTDFNFSFLANTSKTIIETEKLFFASSATSQKISGDQKLDIVYKIDLGNGKTYEHKYTLNGKGYAADFTINAINFADVIPANNSITLNWTQNIPAKEGGIDDERYNASLHYMNGEKEDDEFTNDKEKTLESPIQWVSYKQKFFNTSLIASKELFNKDAKIKVTTPTKGVDTVKTFSTQLQIPFNNSNAFSFPMRLYMGPNKFNELKKMDVSLDNIVPLGWSILSLINKFFILPIFHLLEKITLNYGIIILILAIIIKLVTFPFTFKSSMSMAKMKVLKPEIDELKKKFPDQAQFGQEQMKLFSQSGVSPFGGCLPMLLQMPILIAMYRLFPASIELRQQPFLWATDLSSYDAIVTWKTAIPLIGNHISLFTILMALSSILVTKLTQQQQPASVGGGGTADMMAQQMKIMQYVMPIMLLFMFNKQPAALSYYYFLFNILTLAQNWIIQKFFVDEDKIHLEIQANKKKPVKQNAFQTKMQEMLKQQEEMKKKQGK